MPDTSRSNLRPIVVAVAAVVVLAADLVTAAVRWAPELDPPSRRPTRSAGGAPSTTTTPTTAPPAAPTEPAYITRIKEQVSELRGLPWKAPLTVEVVPRDELTRRAQAANNRDRRPERLAGDEDTLKILHLIPADMDLVKVIDDLLNGKLLGFYDPKTTELVVGDAGGGEADGATKVTVAHELDHALTDQWFELGSKIEALDDADQSEQDSAYTALAEGDAKFLELRYAEKYLSEDEQLSYAAGVLGGGDTEASPADDLPEFILDSLYFPYQAGLEFMNAQAGSGSDVNAGIDAAWRQPPTSTEHILHPETYAAGQGWSAPDLVDLAAATGCEARRRNTLGEFTMRELLDSELDSPTSEAAAKGWNGDVFETVRCGTTLGMVDRWRADTVDDAVRLTAALTEWAEDWEESGSGGTTRIVGNGPVVTLVLGADAATADRLATAAIG